MTICPQVTCACRNLTRARLKVTSRPFFYRIELSRDFSRGTAFANKTLIAESTDRGFSETYRELHEYWWIPLQRVSERTKVRGELDREADNGVLIDIMLGAAWYRMLLEHAPLDESFAQGVIGLVSGNASRRVSASSGTAP